MSKRSITTAALVAAIVLPLSAFAQGGGGGGGAGGGGGGAGGAGGSAGAAGSASGGTAGTSGPGVAERFVVPRKPGNAGGGKGPQFKTDAIRGEGPEIGKPSNSNKCPEAAD